jgi:hypothetical protein
MKRRTQLVIKEHLIHEGAQVIEVFADGKFVAAITGSAHFAGIRVVSKYPMEVIEDTGVVSDRLNTVHVMIDKAELRNVQQKS